MLLTECSVIRRGSRQKSEILPGTGSGSLIETLERQNLTNKNFYIQKADIEVNSDNQNQKFSASIKYETSGVYLISLRSKTGIEAARVYLTKDTVLINDRINRKLFYGNPDVLGVKYGIPAEVVPLLVGDYIQEDKTSLQEKPCVDGQIEMDGSVGGIKIRYTVDCKKAKVITAVREGSLFNIITELTYRKFIKTGDILSPGKIHITDFKTMVNIDITIGKILYPWYGKIEFVPGNKYELIELK